MDVYDEILRLSDKAEGKGFKIGESIYKGTFFFVDHTLLVDQNIQNRIKEFQFCKAFNCPPYPSLAETPAIMVDDFFIIEEEFKNAQVRDREDKKDA